jgi:hypothetical protein
MSSKPDRGAKGGVFELAVNLEVLSVVSVQIAFGYVV